MPEMSAGAGHSAANGSGLFVTLSRDVAPQMREYLRASTTAINGLPFPLPTVLNALIQDLGQRGCAHDPLIMLSNGGVVEPAWLAPIRFA